MYLTDVSDCTIMHLKPYVPAAVTKAETSCICMHFRVSEGWVNRGNRGFSPLLVEFAEYTSRSAGIRIIEDWHRINSRPHNGHFIRHNQNVLCCVSNALSG